MSDPAPARLMLVDGPAAIGPQGMCRIDLETGGRELRIGLSDAIAVDLARANIEARADLISAILDRAALACANGSPTASYERALDAVLVSVISAKNDLSLAVGGLDRTPA